MHLNRCLLLAGSLTALALILPGCVNRANTRLPSLGWNDANYERRSYEYHDPLPDREGGRGVERPRGYEIPRNETRRAIERKMNASATSPDGQDFGTPEPVGRYSDTVQQ